MSKITFELKGKRLRKDISKETESLKAAFWDGYFSIWMRYYELVDTDTISGFEKDAQALSSDWQAVGDDIDYAMSEHQNSSKKAS